MPGHLAIDRARASRIRKKRNASPSEREWLRSYERARLPSPIAPHGTPNREDLAAGLTEPTPFHLENPLPTPDPPPAAPGATDAVPPGHVPVEFPAEVSAGAPDENPAPQGGPDSGTGTGAGEGAGAGSRKVKEATPQGAWKAQEQVAGHVAAPGVKALTCGIPGCPSCSGNVGGQVCAATGVTVWAPMDKRAAIGVAKGLMAMLTLGISFARKDKQMVWATDAEIDAMADAIVAVTYRRINAIGAVSDLLMLASALTMYTMRAARAPDVFAEKKP